MEFCFIVELFNHIALWAGNILLFNTHTKYNYLNYNVHILVLLMIILLFHYICLYLCTYLLYIINIVLQYYSYLLSRKYEYKFKIPYLRTFFTDKLFLKPSMNIYKLSKHYFFKYYLPNILITYTYFFFNTINCIYI